MDMKTPQITLRPIEDLALNPRNAKKHPPKQVKEIKASLLAYGWTVPEGGALMAAAGGAWSKSHKFIGPKNAGAIRAIKSSRRK